MWCVKSMTDMDIKHEPANKTKNDGLLVCLSCQFILILVSSLNFLTLIVFALFLYMHSIYIYIYVCGIWSATLDALFMPSLSTVGFSHSGITNSHKGSYRSFHKISYSSFKMINLSCIQDMFAIVLPKNHGLNFDSQFFSFLLSFKLRMQLIEKL